MGVCNCSMFCCTLLYVHSSIAIILMGKRELVALLHLSSWCLVMVEWLFLAVPRGCLRFVIVVFPDHTHLLCLLYFFHLFIYLKIYFIIISKSFGLLNITLITANNADPIELMHSVASCICFILFDNVAFDGHCYKC